MDRTFQALDLHPVHENASPDGEATEADAPHQAREELGGEAFSLLCELSALDMALYAFARTLFAKHVRGETWVIRHLSTAAPAARDRSPGRRWLPMIGRLSARE